MGDSIFGSRFWPPDLVVRSCSFFMFFSFLAAGRAESVLELRGPISHACRKKLDLHGFMYRNFKASGNSNWGGPIWRTQFWKRFRLLK